MIFMMLLHCDSSVLKEKTEKTEKSEKCPSEVWLGYVFGLAQELF